MSLYAVASYIASVLVNVHSPKANATPKELNPYTSIFDEKEVEEADSISAIEYLKANADSMGIKVVNKRFGE